MIDKGLTPTRLAEELDMAHRTVYGWLNSEGKPTLSSAYKLAKVFGVDPRVFLDR